MGNRNIQGRYNSVRHLQRRSLELPPLRVVSIVDSIVTSSVSHENTKTTRTRLGYASKSKQDIRAKLKVTNHVQALSSHNCDCKFGHQLREVMKK